MVELRQGRHPDRGGPGPQRPVRQGGRLDGGDGVIAGVALAWDAPAADAASVTGYEILRAVGDGDLATLVADTGSAGTTYADDTATEAGESYAYRVKALRGEEASQPSDRAEAIIPEVTVSPSEPRVAEEQSGALWSATLTVGDLGSGIYGCDNSVTGKQCSSLLDDDDFTYNSTTYTIKSIRHSGGGNLSMGFVSVLGTEAEDFHFSVGSDSRPFRGEILGNFAFFAFLGVVWTDDDMVSLSITRNPVVWSATFTPRALGSDLGCFDETGILCSNTANLSDNEFTYDSTDYTVHDFFLQSGNLEINIGANPTAATIADLTLSLDGTSLALSAATVSASILTWSNSGLSWTAGTDVAVSLAETPAAPAVSSVDVTSEPGGDDTYAIGDTIKVLVTFDQVVTVTGAPRIQVRVGGGDAVHQKWAGYTSGSGNEALLFAYTVEAGDFDDNGIYIAADELVLNGGTIQSSDGTDANLDYPLQGVQSGHKVDGVRPTPEFAVTSDDGDSIIIIFSETLSATTAAASAFTLSVNPGTAPAVSTATASGDKVTLGLGSALTSGQVVTVTYVDATLGDDAVAVQDAAGNDAANFTTGEGDVPAVANAVGTGCSLVDGCYVVSADWGLIPSGLGAGVEFRLVFLSSTKRNGASSNINDYNTFVQTAAAAGHADIQQYSSTIRVVGSTADVDARDNTATTYTADDKGVAIYWLGGAKVADEYEDFYDGGWDDEANAKDESGSNRSTSGTVYTGSDHDGTESFSGGSSRALGASLVTVGRPNDASGGPLSSGGTTSGLLNSRPLYGLSPVFRVASQTAAAPAVSDGDDTYAIGDTIQVTVTFDQAVTVTGAPRIKLRVGGGDAVHQKWADYTSGSGNEALLFAYTVEAGDFDDNGIYIAADELVLNGGTIQSSGGTDANLDYPLQGGQSGHNVDGVRPTPEFAVTSVDGSSVIIVFSESLSATTAAASAFTLSVVTGTAPAVSTATATGDTVTLGLASALTSDQVVTVTYTDSSQGDDSAAVQDAVGNDADTFTQTVTNNAAIVVSADWGLIPTGLGAGAEFRLLFRTSGTRNAASTDIADYNTFVQTAAAAGHADIQSHSSTFRVLGSTADVDARDNTFTTYTADDKGVLIYWLNGNKVADDYEDFYDGSWSNADGGKDEHGADRAPPVLASNISGTWTGSASNGTEAIDGNDSSALGASNVRIGQPLDSTLIGGNTLLAAFYGLSGVFRVAGQVVTNTAPALTTVANFSTNENQAATFQVTAMDPDDGDEVTYAITGGADQAKFDIDASSGGTDVQGRARPREPRGCR